MKNVMTLGSKLQLEPGRVIEACYDVAVGFAVGASHSLRLTAKEVRARLSARRFGSWEQ
jgi:hypothetical protein